MAELGVVRYAANRREIPQSIRPVRMTATEDKNILRTYTYSRRNGGFEFRWNIGTRAVLKSKVARRGSWRCDTVAGHFQARRRGRSNYRKGRRFYST